MEKQQFFTYSSHPSKIKFNLSRLAKLYTEPKKALLNCLISLLRNCKVETSLKKHGKENIENEKIFFKM